TETISPQQSAQLLRDSLSVRQARSPVGLFTLPSVEAIQVAARRSTLGNSTLETLTAELNQAGKASPQQTTELYLKVRALASIHPETCARLGQTLAGAPVNSVTFHVLSDALADADNSQAQAALVTVIGARPDDADALLRLLPGLGSFHHPLPAAQDIMVWLMSSAVPNVASTARLALGAMAHNLESTESGRAQQIVDLILRQLGGATSPQEIGQILLALGNAGSARALPVLAHYAADPSPDLRAAALNSLRFVRSQEAEALLASAGVLDPDAGVRLVVARTFSFRTATPAGFQSQKLMLLQDPDTNVRLAVLRNLWGVRQKFPEVENLMRRVARRDASKDVRNAAAELLRQATTPY
ncbi:MAG: HEAT repeat domain-containing protein, partial [Armatimonadetes bacterium]|nr:HEAT repeat domain-containing protein [Armatimonadota bacterium]